MYTRTPNLTPPQNKTVILTGGINESLSNLEMKPGECFDLVNYEEVSGEYHGYRSTMGYERFDGTGYPSDVDLVRDDQGNVTDDTDREDARGLVTVPDTADYLKGAFEYNGDEYCVSYRSSDGLHQLWRAEATGFVEITSFPTITDTPDAGFNYHFEIGRFNLYPLVADGTPNTDIVIMCNGITPAIIMWTNELGNPECASLLEDGPQAQNPTAINLPSDPTIAEGYPTVSRVYNQRLHIGFPYGTLFVSHVGDPYQYDAVSYSAGVWWLGSDITDMVVSPSSLTVFMENGIDVIRPSDPDMITGFDEIKEQFSPTSGAKAFSVQRILGRTLFCDDRGITSLEATNQWGDFAASNISKKIQKTYQANKDIIAGTAVDREKNQYIVYFQDGTGIVVTIEPNYRGEFAVKGISKFSLGLNVNTVWGVNKKSERLLTTKADAYLRKQHKDAQSFDGDEIVSRFTTCFHPYGSPTSYKTFKRLLVELTASLGQQFQIRSLYDYSGPNTPNSAIYTTDPQVADSIWGEGTWGTFVWGGTGAVDQEYSYITGIGVNMAIQFSCSDKYSDPHVVHNVITSYSTGSMKF